MKHESKYTESPNPLYRKYLRDRDNGYFTGYRYKDWLYDRKQWIDTIVFGITLLLVLIICVFCCFFG